MIILLIAHNGLKTWLTHGAVCLEKAFTVLDDNNSALHKNRN
jgi:hypothetical protein